VPALLAAGYAVTILSRNGEAPEGATTLRADLLDHAATKAAVQEAKATHLLHLAWHAGARDRWTSPANLDWVAATFALVQAFAAAGGKRAVCVGSCAEYDWDAETFSEDTPLRPATLYGAAKAAAGLALTKAAPSLNISLAWARVFFCYGPGEPPGRLFGDLVKGLKAGETVDCTDGEQRRDFLHTADIAAALTALLSSKTEGPINIASGTAIPVHELIIEAANQMGRLDLIRLGAIQRSPTDPPPVGGGESNNMNAIAIKQRITMLLADETFVQLLKFLVIGVFNTLFGYIVYALLVLAGMPEQPALGVAYIIGVT
jgi:nucleoside-diphosphate-sugar epimerase